MEECRPGIRKRIVRQWCQCDRRDALARTECYGFGQQQQISPWQIDRGGRRVLARKMPTGDTPVIPVNISDRQVNNLEWLQAR